MRAREHHPMREQFAAAFVAMAPRTLVGRLEFVFAFAEWEHIADGYWLAHGVDLLLDSFDSSTASGDQNQNQNQSGGNAGVPLRVAVGSAAVPSVNLGVNPTSAGTATAIGATGATSSSSSSTSSTASSSSSSASLASSSSSTAALTSHAAALMAAHAAQLAELSPLSSSSSSASFSSGLWSYCTSQS